MKSFYKNLIVSVALSQATMGVRIKDFDTFSDAG